MSIVGRLRALALGLGVGLALAFAGAPAGAVEAPPGSKNFTPPADVPNYFSNESGPFRGGATTRAAEPAAVPDVVLPASRGIRGVASGRTSRHRHLAHAAKASGRTRLAHARASLHRQLVHAAGHRQLAHAGAARHDRTAPLRAAHAPPKHLAVKRVAVKGRAAASKNKHPTRAHG